jgi:hypothetical protein
VVLLRLFGGTTDCVRRRYDLLVRPALTAVSDEFISLLSAGGRDLSVNSVLRVQITGQVGRKSEVHIFLRRLKLLNRHGTPRLQVFDYLLH